jgi:hypothetical protein
LIDFITLKENLAVIELEIKKDENTNVETMEFKSLNPLFQKIETEDSKEYGIIEKISSSHEVY